MKKIIEVLRLHLKLNLSLRQSATLSKISLGTASNYVNRFKEINIDIDKFISLNEIEQEKLFYPKNVCAFKSNNSKVMPDYIYVQNELKRKKHTKVTLSLLYEEYKEANPNNYYGSTQFRDYYSKFLNKINPSMKQVHLSGEKLFVDYSGVTIPIVNQRSGEITKAQIFVAVLGASGYTFVHATYSQKQRDFILSHTLAYDFFGGTPLIVIPDNLKSAVIKHSKKDGIVINESYAALAKHYNMAVAPARPYKPKDKSKAEQGVQGIQRWILARFRHRSFFSVDEINQAISELLDIYNNKIIKRLGKSRTDIFEENEKKFLGELPANRFIYKELKIATVNIDYHVELNRCFYSVPFKYLKEKVELKYSNSLVEIYYKLKLIATHPRLYRINDSSTMKEHMPLNHQYQNEKMNPQRLITWGSNIGNDAKEFVETRLEEAQYPEKVYRSLIAILSLGKLYGKIELNLALSYALKIDAKSVKSVESILSKKLYLQAVNNTNNNQLFNNHGNIRGSDYYK